eukprot:COSAG02_NODE_832_length_16660_cov_16.228006_20_plen_47_part_00
MLQSTIGSAKLAWLYSSKSIQALPFCTAKTPGRHRISDASHQYCDF